MEACQAVGIDPKTYQTNYRQLWNFTTTNGYDEEQGR